MNNFLLVIDLQNDFINENTKDIPIIVQELIKKNMFDYVAFTKFVNSVDSIFYKVLGYKGCINDADREIVIDIGNARIFEKRVYTAFIDELKKFIEDNSIKTIYLCGIDTNACVFKTALDLFENNYDVKVIEDCSMSHSGRDFHDYAIKMLKKSIGNQNVINVLGEK